MTFPNLKLSFWFFSCLIGIVSAELSPDDYYLSTCPLALATIQSQVALAVAGDPRMGASLLRLHFMIALSKHIYREANSLTDFVAKKAVYTPSYLSILERPSNGVGIFIDSDSRSVAGCDASVFLDDTVSFIGEKTARPNNNSLRGFEVIDSIKSAFESVCPGVVSCADILAVAARDSVLELGGLGWTTRLGRRDSTTANFSAANSDLPSPFSNLDGLISSFSNKGFTTQEMVVLSGSHTFGKARCALFRTRIYNESSIDSDYATSLKANCPSVGGDDNLSDLDTTTPTTFDNAYFKNLVCKQGLLHSDQQLYNGGSTDSLVNSYATDFLSFNTDFAGAMVKMGNLSPLAGNNGQIRTNCRKVN